MRVTFYMVRHGQTLFNSMARIQGGCDSPLTEKGIAQALEAKEALSDIPFTKAFSSTSERAYDTCELILQDRNIPIQRTKLLKEFDFGMLDGSRFEEVAEEIFIRRQNGEDFTDIGGDSKKTIAKRIREGFKYILNQCEDGDVVLIVTHGAYGRHVIESVFHRKLEKKNGDHVIYPNTGIMKYEYVDGKYHLLMMPTPANEFKEE